MAKKLTGRPPGPHINIDWDKVDRLLEAGCNGEQVAARFGIHADTLYRRTEKDKGVSFAAYQRQKRANGDSLLAQKQMEVAMKGDKTMLLWLGKQRLGQRDTPEVALDEKVKNALEILNEWTKKQNEANISDGEGEAASIS